MVKIDLYKKGVGVIQKFPDVPTLKEAEDFIESYCQEHDIHVVAREHCDTAYWNYLSNGTEIDYCSE